MDDSSKFYGRRRFLDYVLHPVVLFVLLGGTIILGALAHGGITSIFGSTHPPIVETSQYSTTPSVLFRALDSTRRYQTWFTYISLILGIFTAGLLTRFYYATRQIKHALEEVEEKRDLAWSPPLEVERAALKRTVETAAVSSWVGAPQGARPEALLKLDATIYVRGIELENIRCFKRLGLSFEDEKGQPYLTTILLGDNAAGKSTILRSIALGLCPESDAVSLMKVLSGSFLRDGEKSGSIKLHLRSQDNLFSGQIQTSIERTPSGEVIRQIADPPSFPWNNIFVCGYGTHRSSGRPSSHQTYSAREAVGTLFSDSADLLNPEVVLLRRDPATRERLELILKQILLLEGEASGIHARDSGIELGGPWGSQPLAAVSDGYRSTSQWVLDFLGWQLFADRLVAGSMSGVLMIDELEQHLHPRWQRYFLQRLRAQFGQTQIIASSHTPLVAAGVADVPRSQVVRLIPSPDGLVHPLLIAKEELTGKRADQILTDAFGLVTSTSPGSAAKVDRYTELLSQARNSAEDEELETLGKELEDTWSEGDSKVKRAADKAVSKVLDSMIDDLSERAAVNAHVKQRLLDLFKDKEPGK